MIKKTILLITGANGFIGYGAVLFFSNLLEYEVIATVRRKSPSLQFPSNVRVIENLDINQSTGWQEAMKGVDSVLHCAARYHIPKNPFADVLALCRKINVDGSLQVARSALQGGVKRFIFLSSLKVHGEENRLEQPFRESDALRPCYAYGISKQEAEERLTELAINSNMELVIIRPPPVYGPRVSANFLSLMKCIQLGLPLPIGSIRSLRSYVAIDNLLELVRIAVDHPKAVGEVFLVADDQDWSIADLAKQLALAMGRSPKLLHISTAFLNFSGKLIGKKAVVDLLLAPSCVDASKAKNLLGWRPIITSQKALFETVQAYLATHK